MLKKISNTLKKHYVWVIMTVGLIHGLIYIFIIPPWQHYDEPGHFEYTWIIANNDEFPQKGDFDNQIRSEILESLKRNNFFEHQNMKESLNNVEMMDPVWIGITQVGDPPLYYLLNSLPLRLIDYQSVEIQLFSTRFISLSLYLSILITAIYFAKEIFSPGHPGRILFPLSLCLIPSFADHMTALNNDVAAVLVNSLIILSGVRILKQGINLKDSLLLIFLGGLVYFVKASIWFSVFLIIFVFIASLGKKIQRIIIVVSVFVFIISFAVIFQFGDAAFWYKNSKQFTPTSVSFDDRNVLNLSNNQNNRNSSLIQIIPPNNYDALAGKVVTFGGKVWGTKDIQFSPFSIIALTNANETNYIHGEEIVISSSSQLSANQVQLPEKINLLYLVLRNTGDEEVFFQDPFLVLGNNTINLEPDNIGSNITDEEWNSIDYHNFIRNASASRKWINFRPGFVDIMERIDPRLSDASNKMIYSLDLEGTFWYLKASAARVFRTFWALFGWGNIYLDGSKPYRLLLFFTFLSMAISLYVYLTKKTKKNYRLVSWLSLFVVFSAGFAWFTGISMNSLFLNAYLPVARFIYPAIFPILLVVVYGWANIMSHKNYGFVALMVYLLFFIYLDIISIITIIGYF